MCAVLAGPAVQADSGAVVGASVVPESIITRTTQIRTSGAVIFLITNHPVGEGELAGVGHKRALGPVDVGFQSAVCGQLGKKLFVCNEKYY